jgi:BirA family transcriptional regulator, biotin operon repressor / biotin---[acetyl-CoA-carboxylase] ligase
LPRVVAFAEVGSTLDIAHALAADDAPAGTLILANAQTSGRGRMGRSWRSEAGAGIWMTLIERPRDVAALEVLSLRIGLSLAPVLDAFTASAVQLKWPNDLYVGARKLGGILVEARWRDSAPEWVAVGVGINVRAPENEPRAVGLGTTVSRVEVLSRLVPAMRDAATRTGSLDRDELDAFAARDAVVGRRCREPIAGSIRGVDASGALLIDVGSEIVVIRAGSLVLEEEL